MMSSINEWCVPSNRGWGNVAFDAQILHQNTGMLEHSVNLTGKFWYRAGLNADPPKHGHLMDDFRITLLQVLIPRSACEQLLSDFEVWLTTRTFFRCSLVSEPDQFVMLEVGERSGLTSTREHPVLTFCYEGAGCCLEVFFVVDQSCISKARDSLTRVLQSFDAQ